MRRRTILPTSILPALVTALGLAMTLNAQAPKKFGTIFKREVDGLVNALSAAMNEDGSFGDGSALQTAKVLVAMGDSHRFYSLADGPVTRKPVHFLFTHRTASGGFGGDDVTTTQWVLEALTIMEPDAHATEIAAIREWLAEKGVRGPSPWRTMNVDLAASMRQDAAADPERLGADAARAAARGAIRGADGAIDYDRTIDTLLTLVACQSIARDLDRGNVASSGFSDVAQRGFDYLLTQQEDGVFFVTTKGGQRFPDIGLSGLGLAALQTKPVELRTTDEQELIRTGIQKLLAAQNEDGSFGQNTVNYATSAAILALSMTGDPSLEKSLLQAREYILRIQNIEDRGYARGDRDYGSIGYGGDQRGDLSNLGFAVQALRKSGLDENHEAFQKAIVFLQRTQNLRSVNDFKSKRVKDSDGEWQTVTSGDDGGAAYYPGNSPAGYDDTASGERIPRSYGSMTYMLLRTYTLAGVGSTDHRVQKAVEWIGNNWTLSENPGASPLLPEKTRFQGLYYYYMVLAQALDAAGIDPLPTLGPEGETKPVDWRKALRAELGERQQADGSWVNEQNGRWWESQPLVCTMYAMLALAEC